MVWEEYLNSEVKVIYDDGNRVVTKTGLLLSADSDFILIKTNDGDEAISKTRIIRITLQNKGDSNG